jgi:geranylgeranyl pyrophosphate synthase
MPRHAPGGSTGDASGGEREAIDAALAAIVERPVPAGVSRTGDAIGYALAGGGKRVRGRLLLASYRAAGGRGDAPRLAAAMVGYGLLLSLLTLPLWAQWGT